MTTLDLRFSKTPTSALLYGLFFEDINHALDGGLNADLIQNGSFNFCHFDYGESESKVIYEHMKFWTFCPNDCFSVTDKNPLHKNKPFSLRLTLNKNATATFKNLGYEIDNNQNYTYLPSTSCELSFFYSSRQKFDLHCFFEYANGHKSKGVTITPSATTKYQNVKLTLPCQKGFAKIVFEVSNANSTIDFANFSLIPSNFYVSQKNKYPYAKLNSKLVDALDNMKAKFLRFPGGCVVEGDISTDNLYEWEKTIGTNIERGAKPSVWNYLQSNEFGFFEYLCLCEDLNVAPLPVHHVGLICQIRTEVFRHRGYFAYKPGSLEFKEKVVDSIAHLIYFAKGSTTSKDKTERLWATKRKLMGHAKPFKLNMLALGNENWDKIYFRNFNACLQALKNYPYAKKSIDLLEKFKIQIISSSGVDINPQDTNPSWQYITDHYDNLIIDEHVYNRPEWFIDNYYRYDNYSKNSNKVFVGEYACHTQADGKGRLGGKNTFASALSEAVFMCGMENNPQVVKLSCYAPLFCKKGHANWDPDLIYFDKDIILTPNYHVQSLFMQNYGKYSSKVTNKNFNNKGNFALKPQKNVLKTINFYDLNEKPLKIDLGDNLESERQIQNFIAEIEFEKVVGDFTIELGKNEKEGFGFYLYYNAENKHFYYEKLVNGYRMTFEDLGRSAIAKKIKVVFTNSEIKILNGSDKTLARKPIWKVNTKVFSSVTFDENFIYVKSVNIGKRNEILNLNFDEKFFTTEKVEATITNLLPDKKNECSCTKMQKRLHVKTKEMTFTLQPKSVNIIKLKRG